MALSSQKHLTPIRRNKSGFSLTEKFDMSPHCIELNEIIHTTLMSAR